MALTLLKSQIDALPYNFDEEVGKFIAAKEAHRFEGGHAPSLHSLVESAVKRVQYPIEAKKPDDFVRDYEIIDDTPPPRIKTVDEKRQDALNASRQQENAEIEAISPVFGRRLAELRFQDANITPPDERTPEQIETIAAFTDLQKKIRAIQMAGAVREAAIADMTE
jgi:hypothetical protein